MQNENVEEKVDFVEKQSDSVEKRRHSVDAKVAFGA
jgi:hypothetical protein